MRAPPTVHLLLGAYAIGLVAALAWRPSGVGAALLVGIALVWALAALLGAAPKPGCQRCRRGQAAGLIALAPLVVVAGLCVGGARLTVQAQSRLTGFVGETVALRATAVTLPKISGDRVSLDVKVISVSRPARGRAGAAHARSRRLRRAALHLARTVGRRHTAGAASPGRGAARGQAGRLRLRALPRAARRARRALRAARGAAPRRAPRRTRRAGRPAAAGGAQPHPRRAALAGPRGARGHGPGRPAGRACRGRRRHATQRPAAHPRGVGRERRAALRHELVSAHPGPCAPRPALADPHSLCDRLRRGHRGDALDRARRRVGRRRCCWRTSRRGPPTAGFCGSCRAPSCSRSIPTCSSTSAFSFRLPPSPACWRWAGRSPVC